MSSTQQKTRQSGEAMQLPRWARILGLALAFLFLGVFYTGLVIPPGLSPDGTKVMGVILFAICMFVTRWLNNYMTGLFCTLLFIMGGFSLDVVFNAFTTDTPWMSVGIYGLTLAMARTGLAKRLGFNLMKYARNWPLLMAVIFVLNLCFSFMGVSSVMRAQIVAAVIAPMVIAAGAAPWSIERAAPILWTVAAAYFSDRMILTGSYTNPQFLLIMDLDWDFTTWFINMSIPYIVTAVIVAIMFIVIIRPKGLKADVPALEKMISDLGPMDLNEKKALVYVILAFVLNMTTDIHGLRTGYVMLLNAALMACPYIGIYTYQEWLRAVPWGAFFMIGFTRSYSLIARLTGFDKFFANAIVFPGLPQIPIFIFAYFAIVADFAKIGLISNSNTFSLLLPAASAWAISQGLPPTGYGAGLYLALPHVGWFVYQVPTYVYLMGMNEEYQLYTDGHIVRYGTLAFIATLISLPIWYTYWGTLGLV